MERPVLRRTAKVLERDGRVVLQHLDDEVTLEGAAAALFTRMRPYLDGTTTLERVAAALAEPPARVRALSAELRRADVLVDGAPEKQDDRGSAGERMSGEAFHALHRRHATHWLTPVYAHPLWEKITSGRASRAQVLGFAFEKYHYIEGAYEHMGLAAANATPELMPHLARHFIEEFAHGDIYRKGLSSLFSDELILASQPLPSTRALVNFLGESAARCGFSYYAGNELLQLTENTGDRRASASIDDFHAAMRRHYPFTAKLVDAFVAHTNADQKLGHEDVFLQMCRSVPPLDAREVADALNTVQMTAEHLTLFLDGIDTFYGAFPAMPRLASELLAE